MARGAGNALWRVYQGAEPAFQNVLGPIGRDVEGFSARPQELLTAGDDRVLASGRYGGRGSNGDVDVPYAHVRTLKGGRIVKLVQYADTRKYRQAVPGR